MEVRRTGTVVSLNIRVFLSDKGAGPHSAVGRTPDS